MYDDPITYTYLTKELSSGSFSTFPTAPLFCLQLIVILLWFQSLLQVNFSGPSLAAARMYGMSLSD